MYVCVYVCDEYTKSENVYQPMRPNTCPYLEKYSIYHFRFNLSRWLLIEKKTVPYLC